jgi:hypothetical protein
MPKNVRFCKLLKEALKDEGKAKLEYARLLKVAPKDVKPRIASIQTDEGHHHGQLRLIHKVLCEK